MVTYSPQFSISEAKKLAEENMKKAQEMAAGKCSLQ